MGQFMPQIEDEMRLDTAIGDEHLAGELRQVP
jgi:hypothetical protein